MHGELSHLSDTITCFSRKILTINLVCFDRKNVLHLCDIDLLWSGEMELTFMCHTCRSANLCPILADPSLREELEEMVNKYHQYANEDCQGTWLRDVLAWDKTTLVTGQSGKKQIEIKLDDTLYAALYKLLNTEHPGCFQHNSTEHRSGLILSRSATQCNKLQRAGVLYWPASSSPNDSNILFKIHNMELYLLYFDSFPKKYNRARVLNYWRRSDELKSTKTWE